METIKDILRDMREEGHTGPSCCLEWVGAKIRAYADRIEAAAKGIEVIGGKYTTDEMRKMAYEMGCEYGDHPEACEMLIWAADMMDAKNEEVARVWCKHDSTKKCVCCEGCADESEAK